jgi:hypothetical protein
MSQSSSHHNLLAEAYDLLEANHFVEARNAYREAVMMALPSEFELMNLMVSENEERLDFRRRLSERYPDSFETWKSKALILSDTGHLEDAVVLYTEMLSKFGAQPLYSIVIRFARCKAALESHSYLLSKDDFLSIWTTGEISDPAKKLRAPLLRLLAEVHDTQAISTFEELIENSSISDKVRLFLLAKTTELKSLADAVSPA